VKNVHELLAKLAWDFSPQQLDHLFECFQVCHLFLNCCCVFLSTDQQLFVTAELLGILVVSTLQHILCARCVMLLFLFWLLYCVVKFVLHSSLRNDTLFFFSKMLYNQTVCLSYVKCCIIKQFVCRMWTLCAVLALTPH